MGSTEAKGAPGGESPAESGSVSDLSEGSSSAGSPNVRLPEGVYDHPPDSAQTLRSYQDAIAYVFDLFGYRQVMTPIFELMETLEVGLGEAARRAAFRLVDPASGEVGLLRPDFTAQVARMVAARMSAAPRPLRLAYQGRIARAADPLGRGLTARELFQSGIELIGTGDPEADVEILSVGVECFRALSKRVTIDLGHSAVVDTLLRPDRDPREVGLALAAKDPGRVKALAPELMPLLDLYGDRRILERARRLLPVAVHPAIDALEATADRIAGEHPGLSITFDLGERRSLGYYTGLFFAGYVEGASDAVMSGGRYDRLLCRFGRDEPAVGLAIDVGALIGPTPGPLLPRGVVVPPDLAAEAGRRRLRGERAVVVSAEDAHLYAKAHGYRAVLARDPKTGRIIEEPC